MKATHRLRDLLNEGAFEVRPIGNRDEDRFGRKLRVVVRGGRSLGDQLVSEGLARNWTGRRETWCRQCPYHRPINICCGIDRQYQTRYRRSLVTARTSHFAKSGHPTLVHMLVRRAHQTAVTHQMDTLYKQPS